MIKKYTRIVKGKTEVAVIYAANYGTGWSSRVESKKQKEKMLFDPELAKMIEKHINKKTELEIKKYIIKKYPLFNKYHDDSLICVIDSLTIEWVPEGYEFIVNEYDGAESIQPTCNFIA